MIKLNISVQLRKIIYKVTNIDKSYIFCSKTSIGEISLNIAVLQTDHSRRMNSFVHSVGVIHMVRLTGVEPAHMASEATALSTELQAHRIFIITIILYQKYLKFASPYDIIFLETILFEHFL